MLFANLSLNIARFNFYFFQHSSTLCTSCVIDCWTSWLHIIILYCCLLLSLVKDLCFSPYSLYVVVFIELCLLISIMSLYYFHCTKFTSQHSYYDWFYLLSVCSYAVVVVFNFNITFTVHALISHFAGYGAIVLKYKLWCAHKSMCYSADGAEGRNFIHWHCEHYIFYCNRLRS